MPGIQSKLNMHGLSDYHYNLQHIKSRVFFIIIILSPALTEVTDTGAIRP